MNFLSSLFLSLTLLSTSAGAAPVEAKISMICVTEFPTTTFEANQIGDEVHMRVIHHNGTKYAPFHDALVVSNDLDALKQKAQMVEKLGDYWSFKWRRSGCNADTPLFFQCVGEAYDFEVNGIKIHPYAFSITDTEQKTMWGNFKSKNVRLDFTIDKANYYLTMNYQPTECVPLKKSKI